MKKEDKKKLEWYKKLVSDGKELKAEEEAMKMKLKIEIGKRLLQDKDKLNEKIFRKIVKDTKDQLMDLDVKVRDMPFQLRAWVKLAEDLENSDKC